MSTSGFCTLAYVYFRYVFWVQDCGFRTRQQLTFTRTVFNGINNDTKFIEVQEREVMLAVWISGNGQQLALSENIAKQVSQER